MPKKFKTTQVDLEAFYEAVKDVKPLRHNKISPTSKKPPPRKRHHEDHAPKRIVSKKTPAPTPPEVHGEEFISYKQIGVANKTLRNLRKGQYNVEAILDLHGMTIDEANDAVDGFLCECLLKRIQIGLVIHGKGLHSQMPILKNKLNHWLREAQVVLAFCSATPRHGGRGATYILLKRVKEENSF